MQYYSKGEKQQELLTKIHPLRIAYFSGYPASGGLISDTAAKRPPEK